MCVRVGLNGFAKSCPALHSTDHLLKYGLVLAIHSLFVYDSQFTTRSNLISVAQSATGGQYEFHMEAVVDSLNQTSCRAIDSWSPMFCFCSV